MFRSKKIAHNFSESAYRGTYYTVIPQHLAADPVLGRRYGHAEALRLRDLRKRLEDPISPEDVDDVRD